MQNLHCLYLNWNNICSKGGLEIAQGIQNCCNSFQILDLSHNALGSGGEKAGKAILESIKNRYMLHLDLSFNQFDEIQMKEMSLILENDQNLLGIHLQGNKGNWIVDARGFLIQKQEEEDNEIILERKSIKNVKFREKNQQQNFLCNKLDNCWICEGWEEVKFEMESNFSDIFMGKPVFLHLDFENYKPFFIDQSKDDDPNSFFIYRMCPPGRKIKFFFTDPFQNLIYTSNQYERIPFFTTQKKMVFQYLDGTILDYDIPEYVNVLETKINKQICIKKNEDFETNITCKPRIKEVYFKITKGLEWTFENSIFRSYKRDTQDLFDKGFEFDWEISRISRVLANNSQDMIYQIKAMLKKNYPLIRNMYRYLSAVGSNSDMPSIGQNQFSNFSIKSKIIDGKNMKISDLDVNFITTISALDKLKATRVQEKTLLRYQFLEIIVRLAIDKYIRNQIDQINMFQAVEQFLYNNGQFPLVSKLKEAESPQEWRETKLWNEACDKILKKNIKFIHEIWNTWADSRKQEKNMFLNYKSMNLYEFKDMVNYYCLMDDALTEREVNLSFHQSMMMQIDEITSERHIQMSFIEFLEALSRLADAKNMIPIGELEATYTLEDRKSIKLQYKIESMIEFMKKINVSNINEENKIKNQFRNVKRRLSIVQRLQLNDEKQKINNQTQIIKRKSVI